MNSEALMIELLFAINTRNQIATGLLSTEERQAKAVALIRRGHWNNTQVAEITRFSRQAIGKFARREGVEKTRRDIGGSLDRGCLDILYQLAAEWALTGEANLNLLQAAVSTGTGTRLISRLTGVTIGRVLYAQRAMKKERK